MGSHYFDHCNPEERFTISSVLPTMAGTFWQVEDWDQRRPIRVYSPTPNHDREFVFEALDKFIDDLPPDVMLVNISEDGAFLSSSSNPSEDLSLVPFYPSRADFPPDVATVRRCELTEVDRLGLMVDLTTYQPCLDDGSVGEPRKVVFKYFVYVGNRAGLWHEANCVMRIPKHPNIVPFDALVLDKVGGDDKVVGFATRYVPGGTLRENKSRVFKLKYLKQLIEAVDYLNLTLGIVHGDICPWNLLIDPETDNIKIFDFNSAAKLGWEGDEANNLVFGYEEDRNDVKFVVFTLHEIITREFCFRREFYPEELDASKVLKKRTWKKHPDVQLDSPVTEYRRVLAKWVDRRKAVDEDIRHFTNASEPLNWPPVPSYPDHDVVGRPLERAGQMRILLVRSGDDFLKWQRPPTRHLPLPKGQRLLATGEVVSDEGLN